MRRLLSSYPVVIKSVITSAFSVSFLSVPVVYAEAEDVVYVTAADDEHYEPRGYGALRQSAATKGSASLAETPQFVSVIRRDHVRYLGATQGDNTNSFTVPAVWLGDVSLRYQMDALTPELSGMELGVTISNIANTSYVAGCTSSTYCSIGNDRAVVATLNYFF